MRGSVKYQIEGAIKAWAGLYPDVKAIICPAYPEMGRTIEAGHLYVNGVPVNETASGKDPICPVHSSSMQKLLPDAQVIRVIRSIICRHLLKIVNINRSLLMLKRTKISQ